MSLKVSFLLCLGSAILLILSFPIPNIEFFAWFGLVPLLFAIDGKKPKEAFLLSYFTGLLFFFGILYWLIHITLPGLIALVLYLGLYFGVFGLLVSIAYRSSFLTVARGPVSAQPQKLSSLQFKKRMSDRAHFAVATFGATCVEPPLASSSRPRATRFFSSAQILFAPCLWVSLEFLRSYLFTGFGWALLGYSQYLNLSLIQISDITGAYGVSFLIVMVNVAIWEAIRRLRLRHLSKLPPPKLKIGREVIIPILCLFFVLSYGFFRLHRAKDWREIKISLIQGNIPQDIRWDEASQNFIVYRYERLTRIAAFNLPQLIIWPETAVPVYPDRGALLWNKVFDLVRDMKIPLLIGLPRRVAGKKFNSAALISEEGEITAYYDKLRLVPFGEYVPLGNTFSFIKMIDERTGGGEFSQGGKYTIFEIPLIPTPVKFAVLICYEDIFPHLARSNVRRGADFLVNITNDAWFGHTSAPYQHTQASVFRAVENRVDIVRSANTGPSLFINSRGRIIFPLTDSKGEDLFVTGYKTAKIRLSPGGLSFYTRFGDLFAFLCIVISVNFLRRLRSKPS